MHETSPPGGGDHFIPENVKDKKSRKTSPGYLKLFTGISCKPYRIENTCTSEKLKCDKLRELDVNGSIGVTAFEAFHVNFFCCRVPCWRIRTCFIHVPAAGMASR